MGERYVSGGFNWTGRVDGDSYDQLRWHQVVKQIDLDRVGSLKKGFCLLGFKCDMGVKANKGRPGAAEAPDVVRAHLASLPCHLDEIGLYDAGDVICEKDLDAALDLLADRVRRIFQLNLFPIVIGGSHDVAFGTVSGYCRYFGDIPGIVNFDAHFDMRDYSAGPSSGTAFKQIGDICNDKKHTFKYCCVGVQKAANTRELFNRAKEYQVKWIDIEMVRFNSTRAIKELDEFVDSVMGNLHLSICCDVFANHVAPGVSAPQPFGMDLGEFLNLFYFMISTGKLKSFDIAEVSPPLDIDGRTSRLAAHIIFRLVDGLVFNKLF